MPKTLQLFLKKETFLNQNKKFSWARFGTWLSWLEACRLSTCHESHGGVTRKPKCQLKRHLLWRWRKNCKNRPGVWKFWAELLMLGNPKCYLVWSKAVVALALNWIESKHNFLIDNCHAWTLYTNMIVHVKRKTLNWAKDWEKIPA